jgi:hypothetical protein
MMTSYDDDDDDDDDDDPTSRYSVGNEKFWLQI